MMKKYGMFRNLRMAVAAAVLSAAVLPGTVSAQDKGKDGKKDEGKGLDRQVEVTRDYEPTVSSASKLGIEPNMRDTVPLRPDISYKILPTPFAGGFAVAPIRAASLSMLTFDRKCPLYVRAALGYPFQSAADVFYSLQGKPRTDFSLGVSHYGSYSKIKNDYGEKAPALYTTNRIAADVKHRFGRGNRYSVGGGVSFDHDALDRFGYYNFNDPLPATFSTARDSLRQRFNILEARVNVGNDFTDLSYFNFNIGADVHYLSDRFDSRETGFGVHLDMGKAFKKVHEALLSVGYHHDKGSGRMDGHKHTQFSAAPTYRYNGDKAKVAVGFKIVTDKDSHENGTDFYMLPQVDMQFNLAKNYAVLFFNATGEVAEGSYRDAVALNPYVMSGLTLENNASYDLRAGIEGNTSAAFSYRAFAGVSFYRGINFFANYYDGVTSMGNTFVALSDTATMWTVGGEISGRISRSFEYGLRAQYMGYSVRNLDKAGGMPNFEVEAALRYNYRDKFSLGLTATGYGRRFCYEVIAPGVQRAEWGINKIKANVNLALEAGYNISEHTAVFINADNLLNSRQYRFNRYPSLGINAMCGVKLCF